MDLITPVGRIVWGNPLNGKPKLNQQQQPVLNDQGQPVTQWAFGVAFNKSECAQLFQAMQQESSILFPNGVPQNFAWKFKDGDGLDDQGKPFNTREGYAGCIVLSIVTEAFAPRVVRLVGGAYQQWTEVKCGDYVRVAIGIKAHAGKAGVRGSVPGLYINPQCVEFIGFGQEIVSGPDAMSLFGGASVAMPNGASATPLAPLNPMPMQPAGMPGMLPQGQPMQPAGMPGMMPQGQPMQPAGMPGMMPGNLQTQVSAQPAVNMPNGAPNMGFANGAMMSPSNPAPQPHNGFVNQMMPGMLPNQ